MASGYTNAGLFNSSDRDQHILEANMATERTDEPNCRLLYRFLITLGIFIMIILFITVKIALSSNRYEPSNGGHVPLPDHLPTMKPFPPIQLLLA